MVFIRSRINDKKHLHFNSATVVFEVNGNIPLNLCGILYIRSNNYTRLYVCQINVFRSP